MVTLVLLPGMDGTGSLFESLVSALGDEFKIVVVRYPTAEALGYAELEPIARAALPADGPFVILGESFSGPIAITLAASGVRGLEGLVLCCTFVRNPRPAFGLAKPLIRWLPFKFVSLRLLSDFLLSRWSTATTRAALAEALAQVSPAAFRARVRAVLNVNVSTQLAEVNVPVLYLRAARDRVVPNRASALVRQLRPQAKVVELDGPHFLLQASPAEAARAIAEFVRDR